MLCGGSIQNLIVERVSIIDWDPKHCAVNKTVEHVVVGGVQTYDELLESAKRNYQRVDIEFSVVIGQCNTLFGLLDRRQHGLYAKRKGMNDENITAKKLCLSPSKWRLCLRW